MNYSVHNIKHVTVVTLIASLLFLASHVSMAQVSEPTRREETTDATVNLEECINIALENNLQIAASRNKLGATEADRIKASLLFPSNPKLNSRIGERDGPDGQRTTDYSFSLSQEFQVYGQRRKRINVSDKLIERVKFEIADIERNVIAMVKTNFYEALTALEILKLRKYVESIFEKLWDATRERYKAGAISVLELNSINIGHGQARQQLLVAESSYQNSLLNLKLLLGKPRDEILNIEGNLSYEKLQTSIEDLLASAYKIRPDLMAISFEKERASNEISLRKAEIVPNPSLSGFFGREERMDDIVGGSVSISIPVWDRKQSELKRARTAKSTANINIKKKQLEIQKEVETAYRTFMAAKGSIAIYTDEIIPKVDESLKLNEISYKEGKIDFIGFLTVQKNLLEARAAYLNALLDYNNAIINLETVSGMKLML
ncbi:MAG: TolC family protein [Candidatus Scalindua rubra]|uniref:Efflux transporter n=1 Tax=Candidatus Scalindua brodae TaxID=237368 RepID=A0A0B0EMF6_9BACT|nr:MAG: efflux transporter [Candidatus Scalindua brodae]MBZ0109347.1 TolC family protein [Candidatus Scalindua rubra]TWU36774.1 Cobalt-zinc-cadmium resistance protein CzcC precursor [Candidatus Brocadiaceae bacterium S225]